jgi:integrase
MGSIYRQPDRKYWQLSWVDEHGQRQRKSSKTTDKTTAMQMLAAVEKRVAQFRAGILDPETEIQASYGKQGVQQWVDDYIAHLEVTHGTENDHVSDTRAQIEKILAHGSITQGSKITAQLFVDYSTARQKADNLSARTIQSYLVAFRGFTGWCCETNRLSRDPLSNLRAPSPARDRRYERRALTHTEWQWLYRATIAGTTRRGLNGKARSLLYELSLVTGLRSKEIGTLRRSSFVLSGPNPYVMLPSANTKNQKPAEQMLTEGLASRLRDYLSHKLPAAKAFPTSRTCRLSDLIHVDLSEARKMWLKEAASNVDEIARRQASDFLCANDHEGKRIDFHSIRYTCGAWLALAGIHPKQIQAVMRHSTIRLTLDTYGHLFPEQRDAAIEALTRATRIETA